VPAAGVPLALLPEALRQARAVLPLCSLQAAQVDALAAERESPQLAVA
jgi:hypothetical protein